MPSRLPAERGSAASTTSLRRFTATRADPEDYRSLFIRCCFLRQPAVLSIRGYFRHRPLRLRGTLPRPPSASSAAPSSSRCSEPSPLWPPDVCIVRQNTSPAAVQPLAGLALTYVEELRKIKAGLCLGRPHRAGSLWAGGGAGPDGPDGPSLLAVAVCCGCRGSRGRVLARTDTPGSRRRTLQGAADGHSYWKKRSKILKIAGAT